MEDYVRAIILAFEDGLFSRDEARMAIVAYISVKQGIDIALERVMPPMPTKKGK